MRKLPPEVRLPNLVYLVTPDINMNCLFHDSGRLKMYISASNNLAVKNSFLSEAYNDPKPQIITEHNL
jgi:hypothetical protein